MLFSLYTILFPISLIKSQVISIFEVFIVSLLGYLAPWFLIKIKGDINRVIDSSEYKVYICITAININMAVGSICRINMAVMYVAAIYINMAVIYIYILYIYEQFLKSFSGGIIIAVATVHLLVDAGEDLKIYEFPVGMIF